MLYLVFAYKFFILSYSPHFCDSIALCFVLNGAVVIELYVIKFASTSDMCFTGFFFLHKILYHSIRLIRVILTHMVSSWKVQYLLSYLQFTMLANKTIKIACFGNLGFKKMGILKKNKLLFREGVSHKQRETRGFCQKQGFWLESSLQFLRLDHATSFVLEFVANKFINQTEALQELPACASSRAKALAASREKEIHEAAESAVPFPFHGMLGRNEDTAGGKLYDHFEDFFTARARRQAEIIKLESNQDRQRRESLERNPGIKSSTMYTWEKARSSGGQ